MLQAGAIADLIAIPLAEVGRGPRGAQSLEAALVYGTSGASVASSLVGGSWTMRDRRVLTLDVDAALAQQQRDYDILISRMAAATGEQHGRV